jgi:hypothetical protein
MADTTLTDPLGRRIVLHDRTWEGHIAQGHPEVAAYRDLAEQAVCHPDEIRISNSDPDCRLYYGPGPYPAVTMMVVANIVVGVVKTAHLARKVTGGAQEWSK